MSDNIWCGKLVRLRALEPGDADSDYYAVTARRNTESDRLTDMVDFPVSPAHMRGVIEEMSGKEQDGCEFWFVIENDEGEIVGNINTHSVNRRFGYFRYGIDIAEEYRHKGYGTEAVLLLLRFFFCELRFHKVNIGIYSFNGGSKFFHEKLGFIYEGSLRETVFTHGRYFDELLYGMTYDEFIKRYPNWI